MAFDRYRELGDFLRTRRARIVPATVGLPVPQRRRSSGLLREEVAVLANVSPAWYARLEQGNRVHPSGEVLDSVATALLLSDVERRYMRAVGAARSLHTLGGAVAHEDTIAFVRDVVGGHEGSTLPLYAVDGRQNLLAWNPATTQWYADFDGRRGLDLNILWWMFTDPHARRVLPDWPTCARETVATARFATGTCHLDAAQDPVLSQLRSGNPEFARWWDTHDVLEPEVVTRHFHHPRAGRHTLRLLALRPAVTSSVWIVHHVES